MDFNLIVIFVHKEEITEQRFDAKRVLMSYQHLTFKHVFIKRKKYVKISLNDRIF